MPRELALATQGPDWPCNYCSGTNNNEDIRCDNCGALREREFEKPVSLPQGQGARPSSTRVTAEGDFVVPPVAPPRSVVSSAAHSHNDFPVNRSIYRTGPSPKVIMGIAALVILFVGLMWLLFHKTEVQAEVASVGWVHQIHVDRYQVVEEEGFDEDQPSGAFEIRSHGTKFHHNDQVVDYYKKPHTTDREQCGTKIVGYTSPQASSNDNGTATVSTKPITEPKYCDVPCTHPDVPVYKDVPRYETWYTWNVWKWKHNRTVESSGYTVKTSWPGDDRVKLNNNLRKGEKERARREVRYKNTFKYELQKGKIKTKDYNPKTLEEFEELPVGTKRKVLVSIAGGVTFPKEE